MSREKRATDKASETEFMTFYVPVRIATDIRVRCAEERRSLSSAATEAFSLWLTPKKESNDGKEQKHE
jgi:hypothetical protein